MPDIHQERVDATERFFAIKNLRPSREYADIWSSLTAVGVIQTLFQIRHQFTSLQQVRQRIPDL